MPREEHIRRARAHLHRAREVRDADPSEMTTFDSDFSKLIEDAERTLAETRRRELRVKLRRKEPSA